MTEPLLVLRDEVMPLVRATGDELLVADIERAGEAAFALRKRLVARLNGLADELARFLSTPTPVRATVKEAMGDVRGAFETMRRTGPLAMLDARKKTEETMHRAQELEGELLACVRAYLADRLARVRVERACRCALDFYRRA